MKTKKTPGKLRLVNALAIGCFGLAAPGLSTGFAADTPQLYDFTANFGYTAIHTGGDVDNANSGLRRYGGSGTNIVFATQEDPIGVLLKGGTQGWKRYSLGTAAARNYHWQDSPTPVSYTIEALSFTTDMIGTQGLSIVLYGNGVTYNGNGAEYASPNVLGLYITMVNPAAGSGVDPGKAGFKVDVRYKINNTGSFGGSPGVSLKSYAYDSADFSGTFGFTIDQTNTLKVILNGVTQEDGIVLSSSIVDAFSENCDFGVVLMGGSANSDVQFRMDSLSIKSEIPPSPPPVPEPAAIALCLSIVALLASGYRKVTG
ncbi:MAG: hypothetical protein LBK99_03370 [Opitutaceae bacterium]|jgi:hypothetical protein|nr:hypothetical protein [Opitutaceae bacterium]